MNFVIVGLIKGILYRYSTKNPWRDLKETEKTADLIWLSGACKNKC